MKTDASKLTWVHNFYSLIKSATNVWQHPDFSPLKKIPQIKSAGKVIMFLFFFNEGGVVYQLAVPPKTTMKVKYYISILRQHMLRKHPKLEENGTLSQ